MSSSKKLTWETLRQVFIRVYRLVIQSVMLVFSTQLCDCSPSNLLFKPFPLPLPCVNYYTVYTYTVCRGVMGS